MKTKKTTFLGLMVSYSLVLYIIETYIPNPLITLFPGAKLGLSNIITLVSLITLGIKDTCVILTVRIILSSIFAGPISYLLFSIAGAYLSLICMYISSKMKGISLIGVSIIGAIGHNVGQLLVASLIVENINMLGYLPFMFITSLITGVFVGIVSMYCCNKLAIYSKSLIDKE